MAIATFWKEDQLPILKEAEAVKARKTFEIPLLVCITGQTETEIERRFQTQNDAWILEYQQVPVAFGWVARSAAPIGELGQHVTVPEGQVYLWNFRTLPAWRGKGFYPLLLQAIMRQEIAGGTEKLWILTAPENIPSFKGVQKAGFSLVGELAYNEQNSVVLVPEEESDRVDAAAHFLNMPQVHTAVKPCWCCNSRHMRKAKGQCDCSCNTAHHKACNCVH